MNDNFPGTDMPLTRCPNCEKVLAVEARRLGNSLDCRECGDGFIASIYEEPIPAQPIPSVNTNANASRSFPTHWIIITSLVTILTFMWYVGNLVKEIRKQNGSDLQANGWRNVVMPGDQVSLLFPGTPSHRWDSDGKIHHYTTLRQGVVAWVEVDITTLSTENQPGLGQIVNQIILKNAMTDVTQMEGTAINYRGLDCRELSYVIGRKTVTSRYIILDSTLYCWSVHELTNQNSYKHEFLDSLQVVTND